MGKMPAVLKMARQMNQASWLWRALFHRAISFQTPSQMASRTITTINTTSNGPFIFVLWLMFGLIKSFDVIPRRPPLAIFFQHERDGFNRGFLVGEGSLELHQNVLSVRRTGHFRQVFRRF